jgi:uridylate kinase
VSTKKRILLKLTGEIFLDRENKSLQAQAALDAIRQMRELSATHQFGIVVGGGNFFRGNQHGKQLGITPSIGHQIGMLATMMNGLILADLCAQHELTPSLLCAMSNPEVGKPISQETILDAIEKNHLIIFTGGTGNPFFTTDTTAILRALQMSADEIWKGTNIDGIYDADPRNNSNAKLLKKVTFDQALQQKLGIMDTTAYALAQKYGQRLRVFNIFTPDALIHAARDKDFGSIIQ